MLLRVKGMSNSSLAKQSRVVLVADKGMFKTGRYPFVPGIYTEEQTEAWKPIVKVGVRNFVQAVLMAVKASVVRAAQ